MPALGISDVTVTEGNTGTLNAVFTVRLAALSSQAVTVHYATANGTARAGSDYVAKSGTLTIAANTRTGTIAVPIIGDTRDEPVQRFFVNLSTPTNAALTDAQGVGTILDNDPAPTLRISDRRVTEPNSGSNTVVSFTVNLSAASEKTVTVQYETTSAGGTATAGADYQATSGTLTFTPGALGRAIAVTIIGDNSEEPNETFLVKLSAPVNATIEDGNAVGTIVDNDGASSGGAGSTAASTAPLPAEVSAVEALVASDSVQLSFSGDLEEETAVEVTHYAVQVNGRSVVVESAAYDAGQRVVTLGLGEGSLHRGDKVVVAWYGLLDAQGNPLNGEAQPVTAH